MVSIARWQDWTRARLKFLAIRTAGAFTDDTPIGRSIRRMHTDERRWLRAHLIASLASTDTPAAIGFQQKRLLQSHPA